MTTKYGEKCDAFSIKSIWSMERSRNAFTPGIIEWVIQFPLNKHSHEQNFTTLSGDGLAFKWYIFDYTFVFVNIDT